ncbi:MAG: helix-turn-helix domain-containing protein [Pseudonocardiaceae bacterium]
MVTVECWTGAQTQALRQAMRLTIRAFAAHLGVDARTVNKWEARGATITLLPDSQALMDTALSRAPDDVQTRFAQTLDTSGQRHHIAPRVGSKPYYEDVASGVPGSDVFVVLLPRGGIWMPLSRRELLGALGVGITSGRLQSQFERALDDLKPDSDLLQYFSDALAGFQKAARALPSQQLVDGLLGNVAILDGLRRRAAGPESQRYGALQARSAELLSWLSEEASDLPGAMYWIDRVSQWAHLANWPAMTEFSVVRRSMMIISFSSDGRSAVSQARHVLDMPDAAPRTKGLAATQTAFGYALVGDRDASRRSLDAAMDWLVQPVRGDDEFLGQRSVEYEDLFVIFQATCDIYLDDGARVIPMLESKLPSLSTSSVRTATITRAKLARAYANAGQPAEACRLSWETLEAIDQVDSLSALNQLRHTVQVLDQWCGRSDVQDVMHRLGSRASIT